MEVRLFSPEQRAYRIYAILIFYKFEVIEFEVAKDFIEEGILRKKLLFFPPLEQAFLTVRFTGRGSSYCKIWAKQVGYSIHNLGELNDPYLNLDFTEKYLMSAERLR